MAEDRRKRLEEIEKEVRNLEESPLYEYRRKNNFHPVIGEGNLRARVMFIGEAPGKQEAKTGRPFVGAAGKTLDRLLAAIGVDREEAYITNILKDRPPDNRDPQKDEIEIYSPFLLRQIDIIQPEVIATLGRFAMDFILDYFDMQEHGQRIGELHGQVLAAQAPYGQIAMLPLYHPAAALYNNQLRETMQEDFKKLKPFFEDGN